MATSRRLRRPFFLRPTEQVARDLLGRVLVRRVDGGRVAVRIVETEAYLGADDAAAHTAGGRRTARVEPMWGRGGHAYVYFTYGLHHCMNVVTREAGVGEAVLIRAGEPIEGVDAMRLARGPKVPEDRLAAGPANLCVALSIDRSLSGADLVPGEEIWLEPGRPVADPEVVRGPRIGVDYAGAAAAWPLRFLLRESPSVSVRPVRRKTGR